jgi:glycosyltransferase involved in cell wall biosynthesis
VAAIARRADLVIAGNTTLADWFMPYTRRIEILPTAVDCNRFQPRQRPAAESGGFTLGWIGTVGNLSYLQAIEVPLANFLRRHDDATLLVVADRPPVFAAIPGDRWSYRPWNEADEVAAINVMDVGLMPLPDSEWARGKCSYKMLQYLACGKPVVVSPVGMNGEVLQSAEVGYGASSDNEWLEALEHLYKHRSEAAQLGGNGRALVERRFSLEVIGTHLAELFREVV